MPFLFLLLNTSEQHYFFLLAGNVIECIARMVLWITLRMISNTNGFGSTRVTFFGVVLGT